VDELAQAAKAAGVLSLEERTQKLLVEALDMLDRRRQRLEIADRNCGDDPEGRYARLTTPSWLPPLTRDLGHIIAGRAFQVQ
jgi:hypothetical protein